MNMDELRGQIDAIDSQLVELYKQRLDVADRIGAYKRENGLPIYDSERERRLLNKVGEQAGEEHENGVRAMFSLLMDQSRTHQVLAGRGKSALEEKISQAVRDTDQLFPPKAMVACQGVEGAYSQIACEKLFQSPSIMYCKTFENVFSAIESGLCRYGILPIENSLAGSVNSVYDQMIKHHFYIVRSTRIKIDHTLLTLPGVKLEDIKEVYSHEQAINQCSEFLAQHKEWHVNVCSNTAAAAKQLQESGRKDAACISSAACWPTSGFAPAPRPLVIFSPIWMTVGALDIASACLSVLTPMNSTPAIVSSTMRFTALLPAPPTPTTMIRAPDSASFDIISNT